MKMLTVPMKSIVVLPGRGRVAFNRIDEMAESIKKNGFINPILVVENTDPAKPGTYVLVAGERRYRGAVLAGLKEIPVTFRDGLTALQLKIIELEENICRQGLDWAEECELHRQIDELKSETDKTWTKQKTAELVNVSPSYLSQQIDVAKKLRDNPQLREEVRHLPINAAIKVIKQKEEVARVNRLEEAGLLKITTDLRLGSCVDLIKQLPASSVDLLLTDPPYGIDRLEALRANKGNESMSGYALMSEHHNQDIDSVLGLLRELAPELVRVLKPGAHWYMFCGYSHVGEFLNALKPLEFQPPLLVWKREKPTSPGYGYNYLNQIETIIYGHNPPRSKRLAKNMYNVLEYPDIPRTLRMYPTEKPQSLLSELILQSTNRGDTVLDLFAGSASTLKAARALGRKSIGFEINEDSWKRAQLALSGATVNPEPSLLPDEDPEALALDSKFSTFKKGTKK